MKKIFIKGLFAFALMLILTACREDKLGTTIFPDDDEVLDPTSYSYNFDKYLKENYLEVYNLQFRYKMQDVGADLNYNLVPATYENSKKMAVLTKYLWFDVYKEIAGPDFLKINGPRIIHLIGSPAYNPANGTMILGLAEGGLKVSLFRINRMDPNNIDQLNEFYFKTMHHEFAHILHQKKVYPSDFNLISNQFYEPVSWQDRNDYVVASLGFVTPYASSQTREDFVEVIANYIVLPFAQWDRLLDIASKGWSYNDETGVVTEIPDTDGVDGRAVILQKLEICRDWLLSEWEIDLDELRNEVQRRQNSLDLDALLSEIE